LDNSDEREEDGGEAGGTAWPLDAETDGGGRGSLTLEDEVDDDKKPGLGVVV